MGIVGPGLIGATLLDQLRDQVNFIMLLSLFKMLHYLLSGSIGPLRS